MVMVRSALAFGCASRKRTRRSTSAGRNSIHCPRTLTSGAFSLASRSSSAWSICWLTQCGFPVEGADPVLAQQTPRAGALGRGGRRGRLEPHAQTGLRAPPPRRQEHAETGHLEGRRGADQETVGTPKVERETRRRGLAQRVAERGIDAHRPTQLGQEHLVGGAERSAGALQLVARPPDLLGVDEQAEVIGGLQEELQMPGRRVA